MNATLADTTLLETLVDQSQKGDEEAFRDLFDIFFDPLTQYVARRTPFEEVEDLVSEIFVKIIQSLGKYQKKTGGFRAWVFRIAHNHVIDYYRRKKELLSLSDDEGQQYVLEIEDTQPTPDEQTNSKLENKKLFKTLTKLSPTHREILELRFLEGFTTEEIANITGKTDGNIRIMQMRALRHAREIWDK